MGSTEKRTGRMGKKEAKGMRRRRKKGRNDEVEKEKKGMRGRRKRRMGKKE